MTFEVWCNIEAWWFEIWKKTFLGGKTWRFSDWSISGRSGFWLNGLNMFECSCFLQLLLNQSMHELLAINLTPFSKARNGCLQFPWKQRCPRAEPFIQQNHQGLRRYAGDGVYSRQSIWWFSRCLFASGVFFFLLKLSWHQFAADSLETCLRIRC